MSGEFLPPLPYLFRLTLDDLCTSLMAPFIRSSPPFAGMPRSPLLHCFLREYGSDSKLRKNAFFVVSEKRFRPMAGTLITFEGIEGVGKSTQIELLATRLKERGIPVLCTREPGGTQFGEKIRDLVLNLTHEAIPPIVELFLMEAARGQHVTARIIPALKKGRVVLCDRFTDSTLVYQGDGRGLDWKMIEEMNQVAAQGLQPDLTILLDLDVTTGLERAAQRSVHGLSLEHPSQANGEASRFDLEEIDFHERVRTGFLKIAKNDPDRVRVVSSAGTPKEVHERIWRALEKRLSRS